MPVTVPCGQCIGCRLERSRMWAVRMAHEASMHKHNCFITLTYNDQHLPADRSLDVRVFQLFMKRLRKMYGEGIRFFHCGEYGSKYGRPHYHACLFNFDFPDKYLWKASEGSGEPLYVSKSLQELWPFGYSSIGNVTFQSAAYVARYITKKITGDMASAHYEYIDPDTGEIFQRKPEYTTMSRRPGIGSTWIQKYSSDVYRGDFVLINGRKVKPPKFYDKYFEHEYPSDYEIMKRKRVSDGKLRAADQTPERLKVREEVQMHRYRRLKRGFEEQS